MKIVLKRLAYALVLALCVVLAFGTSLVHAVTLPDPSFEDSTKFELGKYDFSGLGRLDLMEIEQVYGFKHSGDYSIYIEIDTRGLTDPTNLYVRVKEVVSAPLGDVLGVKFWAYWGWGTHSPYVVLDVDVDGDPEVEENIISWQIDGWSPGPGWNKIEPTDWHMANILPEYSDYRAGGSKGHNTLLTLIGVILVDYPSARVIGVKIAMGLWTFTEYTRVYVDDLEIQQPAPAIPEFSLPLVVATSLATAVYMLIRRRKWGEHP